MLIPRSGLSIVIATGLTIIAFGAQVGATELHLKDPPPPTFSWGIFGPSGVESITAQDYRNTDGTAGGPIIVLNTHILDVDRDPNERDPLEGGKEDIGIATFQFALWRGSTMGAAGAIDTVGTDHCPFDCEQKMLGKDSFTAIPNGIPGIEDRVNLLYTYGVSRGTLDLHRFVDAASTKAAKLFGLFPRKGTIAVGSDADLVIYDPSATGIRSARTHHSKCDRSIFEGFAVKGVPAKVIVNGRVQFADGKLDVQRGAGRFLARKVETPRSRQAVGAMEMGRV